MNIVNRASIRPVETRWIGVPPWIVIGFCCECGKLVTVRTYGLKRDLEHIKLICKDCHDHTKMPAMRQKKIS